MPSVGAMALDEERDPECRKAAARARGEEEEEEEEEAGEEGLSDSDEEDQDQKRTGSGEEEEKEATAAAEQERSEDARMQSTGLPPACVPAAVVRDRSGRRPRRSLPCLPRMPSSPEEEDRERRRSRRRDLLLSQLCFLALVALLLWSLSSMQEHNGECSLPTLSGRWGSGSSGVPGLGTGRADWAGGGAGHEDSHCPFEGLW